MPKKNIGTLQKEIDDLKQEQDHLRSRIKNTVDESAQLFLKNLINYNEESISKLIEKQIELSQ
jgi:hypothetical protein